jgi:hypothetical protein
MTQLPNDHPYGDESCQEKITISGKTVAKP